MTPTLERIRANTEYDTRTVHYSKRKSDGMFEIVARAKVEGIYREVVLDIQPNRTKALDSVRFLRDYDNA